MNKYKQNLWEILCIIIVFLAPYGYHIDLGPGPNGIFGILWDIQMNYGFRLFQSLEYFPYYIFRIVVLYEVFKLFRNKSTKKRLILFSVISEIIPLLFSIPGILFLNSEGENFIPIVISIPILLIYCVIVNYISINKNFELWMVLVFFFIYENHPITF